MTLPDIHRRKGNTSEHSREVAAASDEFEVLRENEKFIVDNVRWSDSLEKKLRDEGLLRADSQVQNPVQKLRDVINAISCGRHQTALQAFVETLEETRNTSVSSHLRQQLHLDDVSDSDDSTADSSLNTERRLLITRRKMKQWKMKALKFEQESNTLKLTNNTMRELVDRTTKTADSEAAAKIENLQTQQEILKHELLLRRESGAGAGVWRKKEREYQSHIRQLHEQMSAMRRADGEKAAEAKQGEAREGASGSQAVAAGSQAAAAGGQVASMAAAGLGKSKRNHDRSNSFPTVLPALRNQGLRTLPHNAKLPSLVTSRRLPPEGASGEGNLPKKSSSPPSPPQPQPPRPKPRARANMGGVVGLATTTNTTGTTTGTTKLPPLIKSQKLPLTSPRGGRSLLTEMGAVTGGERGPDDALPPSPRSLPPSPRSSPPSAPLKAVFGEQWIGREGGHVDLGNVALHVPANAVSAPVLISVTQTDHAQARQEQLQRAGLASGLIPGLQVRLQPHGQRFLRPVYLQLKGLQASSGKHLVFHKEVDTQHEHDWTDVTNAVRPMASKDDVVISITSFCIIETMRMLVPAVAFGMAIGYNFKMFQTHVLSMLNEKKGPCEFHIFHRHQDPCLQVVCLAQSSKRNNNNNNNLNEKLAGLSNMKYLGYQSSRFELCDGERLLFFLDKNSDLAASFEFNLEESITTGQRFQIPLESGAMNNSQPEVLLVKRRVTEQLDDITLCEAHLQHTVQKAAVSRLDEPDGASEYEEPWEEAMRSNRVALVKTVDVCDILDYLIQNKVISLDEQDDIKSHRTRKERIKVLIDKVSQKGPKGFTVFVQSLSEDYEHLSKSLTGHTAMAAT